MRNIVTVQETMGLYLYLMGIGLMVIRKATEEDAKQIAEIIALYVRFSKRKNGTGKALMQHSMDSFRKSGKKSMIIWCLEENHESRKFYEKMGGKVYTAGTHRWGSREYNMISYLYQL